MSNVALSLSLQIAGPGILGVVSPGSFSEFLRQLQTPAGMYFAPGFRVLPGASLPRSAAKSRAPDDLRVPGWLFIVAGLLIPVIGFELFRSVPDSFLAMGDRAARIWGVVAVAFGLAIACAAAPRSRAT